MVCPLYHGDCLVEKTEVSDGFRGISNMCNRLSMANQGEWQFSVPQIEYPLGGSSKKGSHVNFLLVVVMVLLL